MIVFPSDTKDVIDAIRGAIGRDVTFWLVDKTPCTGCTIDPVSGKSASSFCTVCSGYGYVYTYSGYTVSGHITWGFSELLNWQTGGQIFEGDCRVQIEYTPEAATIIDECAFAEVDGRKLTVRKKILRGVPSINRILVDMKEEDKES